MNQMNERREMDKTDGMGEMDEMHEVAEMDADTAKEDAGRSEASHVSMSLSSTVREARMRLANAARNGGTCRAVRSTLRRLPS